MKNNILKLTKAYSTGKWKKNQWNYRKKKHYKMKWECSRIRYGEMKRIIKIEQNR